MADLNCTLIGGGGVLARCGEVLMNRGHRIQAVLTSDDVARSWAIKAGIPHHKLDEAVEFAPHLACDLLFSIGNYALVPDVLLACAKRMNVNYHYGPLPEYAGLNAPSWAIADRASEFAITWHRIGELVDGGDVLKRVPVPMAPDDTALSLGLRCDEAAIASLADLIDEIAEGRETATPQDLAARRYFSRHTQFAAEGVIDWAQDAEQIVAMVRAADYGLFGSPLVWPKVNVNGQFLAVREARSGSATDDAAPGEVIACDDAAGLHVGTATGTVHLTRLSTLEGDAVVASDIVSAAGVQPGMILATPSDELKLRITEAGTEASKVETYWRERLTEGDWPYRLPYSPSVSRDEQDASPITAHCPVAVGDGHEVFREAYLAGALCTFLSRATAKEQIHIAVTAPRHGIDAEYRELFVAWLPLHAEVDAGKTIAENLEAIGREFNLGQEKAWLRRDFIGRDEALRKLWNSGALTPDVLISWGGRVSLPNGHHPALELAVHEDGGTVELFYDAMRVSRRDVAQLAAQFSDWCERLPAITSQPLVAVDAISARERETLIEEFNATGGDALLGQRLHQLYERAADTHSGKVALVCGDTKLTYRKLDAEANRLAQVLMNRGVGRGDLVGVALDRSIDLVVVLLAVMKTGAAYVPIDPSFPAERICQMIDNADPKLVVTPPQTPKNLSGWATLCLSIDEARAQSSDNAHNPEIGVSADDLAYVIYTSGSTGKPKGVEVSHGALCNFLHSMQQQPGCDESDRLLAVTTISFDIAVLELLLPLICGATTVIAQAHETIDASALLELMERHAITMMQGTPATWQLLLGSGWQGEPRLAKILCGGEALPRQLADRLLACGDSVWNMYGPTETTVWSSAWRVREGDDVVIGSPIANTEFYVLDERLSPVPLGFPGELCIGGAGVARGYHNDPEQTRSRFVDNPFHPGTIYRTGDLARFVEPGKLSLLGRNDGQVKLRGYRIELGDIESAITSHDEISRAVVVGRDEQLVAYCARDSARAGDVEQDQQVQSTALAEWAATWDRAYASDVEDATFNPAGWHNSYDRVPFSKGEMRDWQMSSVDRILSYSPERVFEIGSGSGLMLFSIAPHCSAYHAVDASKRAVEITCKHLQSLPHVTCEQRTANELPGVVKGAFDTVILNSVAQYFPSIDYLTSVLEWATKVANGGRVFVGDVRDLSLLKVFHADVIHFRSNGEILPEDLASRAEHAVQRDRELVISPDFFANLPILFPQITRVDIALRDGRYVNEMTRYRYDVTLHIGESADAQVPITERNWREDKFEVVSLREQLDAAGRMPLRVNDIPNGRLSEVSSRVAAALGDASEVPTPWIDPQDLKGSAHEAGLEMALLPSRSGNTWSFDALFWHAGETPDLSLHPAEPMGRDSVARYANMPTVGEPTKVKLSRMLRPWLAERLPTYMVPAFFVELDEFPLTPNGKIDRKALPDPVEEIEVTVKPASELERDILAVWSDVLGHDRIGINDNFFEIGGDSLRVIRVQTELEKLVERPVSTATLFEHFTIKTLAAHLVGDEKTSHELVPVRRRAAYDEDIAIISMACRLPGGVTTPEEYWELLERGGDGIIDVPKDRWDADALYDPDPATPGKSYCSRGGFVTPIDLFDVAFFGISPREARSLDPMQRMVLEITWEAFERAGYTMDQLRGSQTGAFIGVGKSSAFHEYGLTMAGGLTDLDGYVGPGSACPTRSALRVLP
jgi:amino acid adenylation domain-containing protein